MSPELTAFLQDLSNPIPDSQPALDHLISNLSALLKAEPALPPELQQPMTDLLQNLECMRRLIANQGILNQMKARSEALTAEEARLTQEKNSLQILQDHLASILHPRFNKLQSLYLLWRQHPGSTQIAEGADLGLKATRVVDYLTDAQAVVQDIESRKQIIDLLAFQTRLHEARAANSPNLAHLEAQNRGLYLAAKLPMTTDLSQLNSAPIDILDEGNFETAQTIIPLCDQFYKVYQDYGAAKHEFKILSAQLSSCQTAKHALSQKLKGFDERALDQHLMAAKIAIEQTLRAIKDLINQPADSPTEPDVLLPKPDPADSPLPPISSLAKKHGEIYNKVPNQFYRWYHNLYIELSRLPINSPDYYAACNLLDDLEFELEMRAMGYDPTPLFTIYQCLDTAALLRLKPAIWIEQENHAEVPQAYARLFEELDQSIRKLAGLDREYFLLTKLYKTLYQYALLPEAERNSTPFNPFNDPQYDALKHHRSGLMRLLEKIEAILRSLFGRLSKNEQPGCYPGCLFKPAPQKMVERVLGEIFIPSTASCGA